MPPLVLLHPGGADSRTWAANLPPLAERFHVYTPDRRGHGRTPDVAGPITFDAMARDTIAFIEAVTRGSGRPRRLQRRRHRGIAGRVAAPRVLVKRLVFVCGVFHHEGWLPGSIELDEEADAFLGDWYGEVSPDGRGPLAGGQGQALRGAPDRAGADGRGTWRGVTSPVLVMQGDRDEMPIEHSAALYRALPDARLAVVPGASHGLLVEQPDLCNTIIANFLS